MKNVFHLTQVPFLYTLVTKIQEDGRDIAVNSLELPCENWNMHFHLMVSKGITGLPFQFFSYIADSGVDPSRFCVFCLTFTANKFLVFN